MFLRTFFISILLAASLSGQTHFTHVPDTGIPYIIIVTGVDVLGDSLVTGSEIAVFDDSLCVGVGIFDGNYNYQFSAWQKDDGQGLAGFIPGAPIIFKVWTEVSGEWQELGCNPNYEQGDGTFGNGVFTVTSLSAFTLGSVKELDQLTPNKVELSAYPNPFNSRLSLSINSPVYANSEISIYSLTGQILLQRKITNSGTLYWDGYDKSGNQVASGIYLIELKTPNTISRRRVTYLK